MREELRRASQLRKLSRFLILMLYHRPARFPITLDEQGYAHIGEIMRLLKGLPNFRWATQADIDAVIELPGRRRFERSGDRIRALSEQETERPIYPEAVPPAKLYYGSAPESTTLIEREGLVSDPGDYVRLSTTPDSARSAALRHSATPVVWVVDAAAAHSSAHPFYETEEGIFLVRALPARFLQKMDKPR